METNDHDLLIELKTLTSIVVDNQNRLLERFEGLSSRVSALEAKDRGDSERIGSLIEAVKATNNNSNRITVVEGDLSATKKALEERMDGIDDQMASLRSKSNIMDAINAAGAMIAGVIGAIFGSR
jgi:hypothetical protein